MPDVFVNPLMEWYNHNKRDLLWRHTKDPYRIWVSEIMLQQTRVEAVTGYYARFLNAIPDIRSLAESSDEKLLKLWEGLGYYSRVRNMKIAAAMIQKEHEGSFPSTEEEIRRLKGIGTYTAGAIGSIAFSLPTPAVDGNVLRVHARYHGLRTNILDPSFKRETENDYRAILEKEKQKDPMFQPGDFNQALIELGAIICIPNGKPKCEECPLRFDCVTNKAKLFDVIPVREKKTSRRVEKRTVLLVRDGETAAVRKRADTGLLAGLYEFPNYERHLSQREVETIVKEAGYLPLRVRALPAHKHLFSHVEWRMIGYEIRIASEEHSESDLWAFYDVEKMRSSVPMASAFSGYANYIDLNLKKKKKRE